MGGGGNIGEESDNPVEINVTAMVDVIFCLCIFFMCSFHFKQLEGKIETWLPKDRGVEQTPPDKIVLVPCEGRVAETTRSALPSGSESFASTAILTDVPLRIVTESPTACGAVLPDVTVTKTVAVAVRPSASLMV